MFKIKNFNNLIIIHLLLFALGIMHFFNLTSFILIILTLILISFLTTPYEQKLIYIFVMLPYFNLLSFKIGTTSFFYLFLLIMILSLAIKGKLHLTKTKIIIFLTSIFLSCFWLDLFIQFKWLLIVLIILFISDNYILKDNYIRIIKNLTMSTIFSSIIGLLMLVFDNYIYDNSMIYLNGNLIIRFAGLVGDSVFYSQFCLVILACLISLHFSSRVNNIFFYFSFILLSFFILITYSKTGILLLALLVGIYIINLLKLFFTKKSIVNGIISFIGLTFVLVLSLFWIVKNQNSNFIESIVKRFSSQDLWTGRFDVFLNYLSKLSSSFLYLFRGLSIANYTSDGVLVGATIINKAHNIYLETICLFGLLPSVVVFISIVIFFWKKLASNQITFFDCLPAIILLLTGFTLHGHLEWPYYFLVLISYGIMKKNR